VAFGSHKNPPLIAIGCWIGNWELWADSFAELSQDRFVIGFDHRGSWATICPLETIRFEGLVSDIFRVMDHWHVEKCTLPGESFGAIVALAAALANPHRFNSLVLVDGPYFPIKSPSSLFLTALRNNYKAALDQFVNWCVPEPNSGSIKSWGQQIPARAKQEAAIKLFEIIQSVDISTRYSELELPVLLIHGAADLLASVDQAKKISTVPKKGNFGAF
jgi:pimeloyl-ACP methyl ester carboxylesterase